MQGYRYEFLEELLRISKKRLHTAIFFMLKRKNIKFILKNHNFKNDI